VGGQTEILQTGRLTDFPHRASVSALRCSQDSVVARGEISVQNIWCWVCDMETGMYLIITKEMEHQSHHPARQCGRNMNEIRLKSYS
jgi:hypothetical protein